MNREAAPNESILHALFQHARDAILVTDGEGRGVEVNPAFCELFGVRRDRVLNAHARGFLPLEVTRTLFSDGGIGRGGAVEGEISVRDTEGRSRLLEYRFHDGFHSGHRLAQFRDVSGREEAEAEARREAHRAEALVRVSARLNAQLDLQGVAEAVCEEALRALNADGALLYLYDPDLRAFIPQSLCGSIPSELHEWSPLTRDLYDSYTDPIDTPIVMPDIQAMEGLPGGPLHRLYNLRTLVTAALEREEEIIGLICVSTVGETRDFSSEELALLQAVADQGAQAVVNARLYHNAGRRYEYLKALRAVDHAITSSMDLEVIFNVILDRITAQLQVDAVSLRLLNPLRPSLDYSAGRGFRTDVIPRLELKLEQEALDRSEHLHPGMILLGLEGGWDQISRERALREEGIVSYYALPLMVKGRVKGILEVFHRSRLALEHEWEEFLEILTEQAAIAIDNAALFEGLQRSNELLTLAYDTTLEGWVKALDLRDKETEGHTQRVTELSARLARQMGVSDEDLVHIRRGALLHDIGKVGIPDSILHKPGPLTPAEFDVMKRHTRYAHEMLSPIAYLRPALDIPYRHHERWDGSGYPGGLKGEEIPLFARIFAVVDTWDALRSDRPYRAGWPHERVFEYIRTRAGAHFDARVVDEFLRLIEADPSMRHAYDTISHDEIIT